MAGTMRTTLKLELETSLTTFQKEYHYPTVKGELIGSKSSYILEKSTWRTKVRDELKMDMDGGNCRYTPNYGFDHLHSSTIEFTLPELKIKDEFKDHIEICWPPNVGHNVISEGSLYLDNSKAQNISTKWLDVHSWAYVDKVEKYDRLIGNVPCLTQWTTHLPQYSISVPQVWFYNHPEHPLPIIGGDNKAVNSQIYHQYKFQLKVSDLLRIRVREKAETDFKPCEFSKELFITDSFMIETPKMFGKFSMFTDEERKLFREKILTPNEGDTYYIEDIIQTHSSNPATYGSTVNFSLNEKSPVKAYFWMAENLAASKQKNHSNYTTNTEDCNTGYNPCVKYEIRYGTNIKDTGTHHTSELTECYDMFSGNNNIHGYNVYCNCFDTGTVHPEPAIVLEKLKGILTITLGDSNPYRIPSTQKIEKPEDGRLDISTIISNNKNRAHEVISDETTFTVYLILLTIKKIQMRWSDKKVDFQITDPNTDSENK